jgi:hypothetical protein
MGQVDFIDLDYLFLPDYFIILRSKINLQKFEMGKIILKEMFR